MHFTQNNNWRIANINQGIKLVSTNEKGEINPISPNPEADAWILIPLTLTKISETNLSIQHTIITDGETYHSTECNRLSENPDHRSIKLGLSDKALISKILTKWTSKM